MLHDGMDALVLLNVLLFGWIGVVAFLDLKYSPRHLIWMKLAYGVIGWYWCAVSVAILATRLYIPPDVHVWIIPALTITAGFMAGMVSYRYFSGRHEPKR